MKIRNKKVNDKFQFLMKKYKKIKIFSKIKEKLNYTKFK